MIEVSLLLASPRSDQSVCHETRGVSEGKVGNRERHREGNYELRKETGASEDQWKSKLPGPVLPIPSDCISRNRPEDLLRYRPWLSTVRTYRAAIRLPGTATYTQPKLLDSVVHWRRRRRNGRFLVHFSIPSWLPAGHLEASWLHELPCPILCSLQSCRRRKQFDPPRGAWGPADATQSRPHWAR